MRERTFNIKSARVVGLHLAGSSTDKSSLVVANLLTRQTTEDGPEPFLETNLLIRNIGPLKKMSADEHILQILREIGPADIYIFDAPLSLPPCIECPLQCPGVQHCLVPEVEKMLAVYASQKKIKKNLREPRPYVDRLFEFSMRCIFDGTGAASEFGSILGSNRAPLTARVQFLKAALRGMSPHAQIYETSAGATLLAWSAEAGMTEAEVQRLRRRSAGRSLRRKIWGWLAKEGRIETSKMHHQLQNDLYNQPDAFMGLMSATAALCLKPGRVFYQPDFLVDSHSLKQHPLIPASLGRLIVQSQENPQAHEHGAIKN